MQVRYSHGCYYDSKTDDQHRVQRRTTRVTNRQAVAENAQSTRIASARLIASKARAGSTGLSVVNPPDSNLNNGTSSKPAKPVVSKDVKGTTSTAPIKRKREALSENVGAKALRSKVPVIVDKENQQLKKTSAYVEVPNLVAAPRERAAARPTTNPAAATRSRIVVKRDEVARPAVKEEPCVKPAPPVEPGRDDAILVDDAGAPSRSSMRHSSTRASTAASSHSTTTTRQIGRAHV